MKTFLKVVILAATLLSSIATALSAPASGTYLLQSGDFLECCGITGIPVAHPLPEISQMFIRLDVDATNNRASLAFLSADTETVFTLRPCASAQLVFSFDDGIVEGDRIVFQGQRFPISNGAWNYTVSNGFGGLRINGNLRASSIFCWDVPTSFTHTNVVAPLLPRATTRASEMEICWNSISGRSHQVQYRSAFDTSNTWLNLGSSVVGDGATNCMTDKVAPGEPRRFYRVILHP